MARNLEDLGCLMDALLDVVINRKNDLEAVIEKMSPLHNPTED